MNEKSAKVLRQFSKIQGTSYKKNKALFLATNGVQRKALNVMIHKVVKEAREAA